MQSSQTKIRLLLQSYPDGLTTLEVSQYLSMNYNNAGKILEGMPDTFIDRWVPREGTGRGKWSAVWCAIEVPENCPMPS